MNSSTAISLPPRVLNILAKQQFELANKTASDIKFFQNEDGDLLDIQADIYGPVGTPYQGGVFRCKIVLQESFPQAPPKGYFLTKIFHPNVAQPAGDICVNTLKKDWNSSRWSLSHIFETIRCLLIIPFPESSLNEEAGKQFMEDYQGFCDTARVFTEVHAKPRHMPYDTDMQQNHLQNSSCPELQINEEVKCESRAQLLSAGISNQQNFSVLGQVTNTPFTGYNQFGGIEKGASTIGEMQEQKRVTQENQQAKKQSTNKITIVNKKKQYMSRI